MSNQPILTVEAYRQQWGDCGFEADQLSKVFETAETYYSDLPYHNFQHALESLWDAQRLADLCEANGEPVNRKALIGAALFHDANYHKDHTNTEFEDIEFSNKEEYSAAIFESLAEELGFSEEETAIAKDSILATFPTAPTETLEEKITVRADLSNIFGDYETSFMAKNDLLKKELAYAKSLANEELDEEVFAAMTITILTTYIAKDLSLGDFDEDWSNQAKANIYRFAQSYALEHGLATSEFMHGLGSTVVRVMQKNMQASETDEQS